MQKLTRKEINHRYYDKKTMGGLLVKHGVYCHPGDKDKITKFAEILADERKIQASQIIFF